MCFRAAARVDALSAAALADRQRSVGEVIDSIVMMLGAAGFRGNAFQFPRTFHFVGLFTQAAIDAQTRGRGGVDMVLASLQTALALPLEDWIDACGTQTIPAYVKLARDHLTECHSQLVRDWLLSSVTMLPHRHCNHHNYST